MISFQSERRAYLPKERLRLRRWLQAVADGYELRVHTLTYIFLNDEELLAVNKEYLKHDFYTDIITFDNREVAGLGVIEGDIFISVERVADNAATYGAAYDHELRRVLAHGLLHLCGLGDKTKTEAAAMRGAEEAALEGWEQMP